MNLLVVANFASPRCGVRNWAEQCVTALSVYARDVQVRTFDATFTTDYGDQLAWADQVLLVWHPGPLGHLRPLAPRPRTSIWVAEVPPYAVCPWLDRVQHVFSANLVEGRPDTVLLAYPVVDWIDPNELPVPGPDFTVGWTGIRGVGLPQLQAICATHDWRLNVSDPTQWLSAEDEIKRLARSHVNVCWYDAGRTEMASAPQTCIASRRPLLINNAPMLEHLFPYLAYDASDTRFEIYGLRRSDGYYPGLLEEFLVWMSEKDQLRVPQLAFQDLGWKTMVQRMRTAWGI